MATILSIANMKGGCGKTTTTQSLAGALAVSGARVTVVDVDGQASLYKWFKRSSAAFKVPFNVLAFPAPMLIDGVKDLVQGSEIDFVLIDHPGGDSAVTTRLLRLSNAVIVPVKPGPVDYDATAEFLNLIADSGLQHLRTLLFLSIVPPDLVGKEARARVDKILAKYPFAEFLGSSVSRAVVLNEVLASKQTIFQYQARSKGAKEMMNLTKEVLKCLANATATGSH
jgi:chromosome partitioning protein